MNQTFKNWLIFITAVAVLAGAYQLAESLGTQDVEAAQAADLIDAQTQAEHVAGLVRKCHLLRGPSAELLQIRDTDHYVCREGAIEPVPAELLHRYALLGGGK